MGNGEIEKTIHQEIRDALQHLADRYGLIVDEIRVGWMEAGTVAKPRHMLTEVGMQTRTRS